MNNENQNNQSQSTKREAIRVKSNVKAGGVGTNHNEAESAAITVKSGVKAGGIGSNHNETC